MPRPQRPALIRYIKEHESWRWLTKERMDEDVRFFLAEPEIDEYVQVMAYALMPLTPSLESLRNHPFGQAIIRWGMAQGTEYVPVDPSRASPARLTGILLASLVVDLVETRRVRAEVLADGFARVAQSLASSSAHWARRPPDEMSMAALTEFAQRFGGAVVDPETGVGAELLFAVQTWQRLHWLAECRRRQALVISGRSELPLPADPLEKVMMLHRLGWSQPLLRRWPELVRAVPANPVRLLPPGDPIGLIVKEFARADSDLEHRFLIDASAQRRYALDHVAVIELEQSGLRTLTMAPERRYRDGWITAFAAEHRAGVFFGETQLLPDLGRIVCYIPLCDTLGYGDEVENPDAATPNQVMDTFALLTGAAWRDLVSEYVRSEQYVARRERKAHSRGRRSQARGDVDVVRYLPRRLAERRAQVEAAHEQGTRVPPRRYAVGAFSRRLPAGQQRSQEAEAYAQEIGIPLAPYQTIVHPHFRGGVSDEKTSGQDITASSRRYRSWSALDLLRTRD